MRRRPARRGDIRNANRRARMTARGNFVGTSRGGIRL